MSGTTALWGRVEEQGLTIECIYKKCPKYPSESYFKNGGALIGGCPNYIGYGYCSNKEYGKEITIIFKKD